MHRFTFPILFSLASLVVASPLHTRAVAAPPGGDIDILNYALTLEYLERKFYAEGINNFSETDFCEAGFDAEFFKELKLIYSDERTHVNFLAGALGDKAIAEPTFSFPVTDVHSFVGLSAVLEGVGVSAYLGAAAAIADPDYLTAAGSILAVEARHASYVRNALKEPPFPNPFDTPLDFNQVFSLAAQFITGFAPGTVLPFKAFPPLTAVDSTGKGFLPDKSPVVFKNAFQNAIEAGTASAIGSTQVFAVFFSGLQTYYVPACVVGSDYVANLPAETDIQPAPSGQVYVVLSTANGLNTTVSDENTIAGVGILEVAVPY